jgi:hypothetical protein
MKRDTTTELSTLPELVSERNSILPRIQNNTATVREATRFLKLNSLIAMFGNAKSVCHQITKPPSAPKQKGPNKVELLNPVLKQ